MQIGETEQREGHRAQTLWRLGTNERQIVMVRHGSAMSGTNVRLAYDGMELADPPLSQAGEEQAQAVVAPLAALRPVAIYVTPLQRTVQTAAPLCARLGKHAMVEPDLREI